MFVLFKQFLFHLIVTEELFFVSSLLLSFSETHHLVVEINFTQGALLNHKGHLLLDLLLDLSLEDLEKISSNVLFLFLLGVLGLFLVICLRKSSVKTLSILSNKL